MHSAMLPEYPSISICAPEILPWLRGCLVAPGEISSHDPSEGRSSNKLVELEELVEREMKARHELLARSRLLLPGPCLLCISLRLCR